MTHTVLVIDDDDHIRNLVIQFLERKGYRALGAATGNEGLASFEHESPDLILLDVAMPGMSGFEVAQKVREFEQNNTRSRTPIILLSAYARSFFASSGHDVDIDSYLTKPVPLDTLMARVQKFLDSEPD